jgi:hypothetical protein
VGTYFNLKNKNTYYFRYSNRVHSESLGGLQKCS